MFDRSHISQAAERIAPYLRITPVIDVREAGHLLNLKLESLQVSGTFKARGAFNRLLGANPDTLQAGVVAASGGNHGIAVAHAARSLGVVAHIFVPLRAPQAKLDKLRALGARVQVVGERYADALAASEQFIALTGALRSHAYDQIETLAGQGTIALEWQRQTPDLDTVLIAVGGGGLIGGIAAWFENKVKVVAVEPITCPTLHSALAAGRPVDTAVGGVAADSLGASRVGELMFPIAQRAVSSSVLVSDAAIVAAQHWLWDHLRIAAEPGGAAAMATLLSGAYQPGIDERVGVLICGANVDPASLTRPL